MRFPKFIAVAATLVILVAGRELPASPEEIKSLNGLKELSVFVEVDLAHEGLLTVLQESVECWLRQAGLEARDNPFLQPLIVSVSLEESLEVRGLLNVKTGVTLQDLSGRDIWKCFQNFPVDKDKLEHWTLKALDQCVEALISDWLRENPRDRVLTE